MFKPVISLVTCAVLTFSSSIVSAETKATDFHFKATLTEGSESLRSVELPWSVMSNLLQKSQRDLQVYNAEQKAVPFAVRFVAGSKQSEQQTRKLNFFPMGDIEKLGTILEKEGSNGRYKTIKLVQTGSRYLIIDNPKSAKRENQLPIQSLTLNWKDLSHWLPKSLKVEVSDNLAQWQPVGIKALPYRLSEGGVALENNELRFKQSISQRFIRLSGAEDFDPLLKSLQSVSAQYRRVSVVNDLKWDNVNLKPTGVANQFEYELPLSLPIQQWRFSDLASGSLYKGKLSTRYEQHLPAKQDQWRARQNFLQYALQTEAGLIESMPAHASNFGRTDAWRFDFEQSVDKENAPTLALAWKPMELVFVAQGKGPFEIRYASHTAEASSEFSLDGLLGQVKPEKITITETIQLSKVTKQGDGSDYKYLLWGLLAAAVLMLLFMAKGLLRDMDS